MRNVILFLIGLFALAACDAGYDSETLASDGKPLPKVYRIRPGQTAEIQYRVLDAVNALRASAGAGPVELDPALNAAAATHSRDMSVQNRPWHFGSDGSSPLDRVQRAGYTGTLLGENISETFETEMQTLAAWMEEQDTREVLMDPRATKMGFAWHQERSGKLWWTLLMGN